MKLLIIALSALSCAYAVEEKVVEILKSENVPYESPDKDFHYSYEASNGISSQAQGSVKPINKDEVALEVHGSVQYPSPDGENIVLSYIANENGYQPQGNHLPTPPAPLPIPDYILRSLEYIKSHPYQEKKI